MQKVKRKNNKGISLIALIITIIVMIILVAVTVNVAINGGLFGTASTASQKTERDELYDQIIGAMKLTGDGKIDRTGTYNAVEKILEGQGRTVEPLQEDGTFEVIGTRGTYTYKITEEEIIKGEITGEGSGVGPESGTGNGGTVVPNPGGDGGNSGGEEPNQGEIETFEFPYGKYYRDGDVKPGNDIYFVENGKMDVEDEFKISVQLGEEGILEVTMHEVENGEAISQTIPFSYIATEDNVLLWVPDALPFMVKQTEGLVYDLNGEYVSSDGTERMVFTSGSGAYAKDEDGDGLYIKFAGRYYDMSNGEMVFSDGYKTFSLGGKTYTNENASSTKTETTIETITPSSVDFVYGTYYSTYEEGWTYKIEEDKLINIYISTEEYITYDKESDSIYYIYEYGPEEVNYIKEGNDVILWGEDFGLYATSKNAFKSMSFNLEGEYIVKNLSNVFIYYPPKLVFEKGNHLIRAYDYYSWDGTFSESGNKMSYIQVDGKYYYVGGGDVAEIKISSGGDTITIGAYEYAKVK